MPSTTKEVSVKDILPSDVLKMTDTSNNKLVVLKYTALLCNALITQYLNESIARAEQTLKIRPDSVSTKERLEHLKLGITKVNFFFETGRKYHKIIELDHQGGQSTHAFVDKETGEVYKPASWKSPAKGARYNLLDEESRNNCLLRADWAGAYLYK